jgi:hypothetical protein
MEQLERRLPIWKGEKETLPAAINASGDDYLRCKSWPMDPWNRPTALEQAMERWLELAAVADAN